MKMKITDKRSMGHCTFFYINYGEVFSCIDEGGDTNFYMKVWSREGQYNAVNLELGRLTTFHDDIEVTKIESEMILRDYRGEI
jgi:hypothetical protein